MTDDEDFSVVFTDEPTAMTREEYRETVENIAEKIHRETQINYYESYDEAMDDILENHIYLRDDYRAIQVISLSKSHRIPSHAEKFQDTLYHMAREILESDVRSEIVAISNKSEGPEE